MKLSMSMWSFQELLYNGRMDFDGFIAYCKERDIKYVELLDFFIKDNLEECLVKLKNADITPAVWSICNDFVKTDRNERVAQIEYVKENIDIAKKIGVNVMRIFSGDEKTGVSKEEGTKYIEECLFECVPYAEEKSIILALENHGIFAADSTQIKTLLDKINSPSLRSNFDTANFLFVDDVPETAADCLKGYVELLHLKDYAKSSIGDGWPTTGGAWYKGCPIGDGCVDFKKILETLASGGFNSIASIELEADDPIKSADKSIDYLRRLGV